MISSLNKCAETQIAAKEFLIPILKARLEVHRRVFKKVEEVYWFVFSKLSLKFDRNQELKNSHKLNTITDEVKNEIVKEIQKESRRRRDRNNFMLKQIQKGNVYFEKKMSRRSSLKSVKAIKKTRRPKTGKPVRIPEERVNELEARIREDIRKAILERLQS